MKKTLKPKKLDINKTTLRVLTTNDLQDVVGGTSGGCTTSKCSYEVICYSDVCTDPCSDVCA